MSDSTGVNSFRFLSQGEVIIGNGLFRTLPEILQKEEYLSPSILIDEGVASTSIWREVKALLDEKYEHKVNYHILSGKEEPTYASLRNTLHQVKQTSQDILVGIGGGSCMDTAKAVAGLLTNSGDPLEYRGFDKLKHPGIPLVLVPTTSGTGSEAAYNASFVDEVSHRKMGINGRYMFAKLAILDGEVTLSCPYRAALSAGIDALVHALEGFVCKQRNVMTDMLVKRAFPLLVNALPALKHDKQNLDKRLDLLVAAYLGGMIQMNSGSGVAAAISYPLSVYYKVPHGIGGGMFCLDVIRFNINAGFYLYAELAPLIGVEQVGGSDKDNALAVLHHLEKLWTMLDVPTSLANFGIDAENFPAVLRVMETQQAAFDQNPIPFTVSEDLPELLEPFFAVMAEG